MHAEDRKAPESFVLGGYAILETLGSGGMGVVYRARDVHLGREVALKVLRDDLRNNAHVVARFRREAEAFARLNHPNIVRIYAVGVVGKIPFIAMELIDGEPLNVRLTRQGPMPWRDAFDIGLQLADALAAAHEHGVIHRDIKPGNILLGRNGRVYLTDFGIAKVVGATTQLTVDGARLGTPQYLCPERCRNEAITPASDLYSLGVVLFQAISGRLPFEAANSVDLICKIAGEVPTRLSSYVPDIPESIDRFLAHVLDPDPAMRPQDARALRSLIGRMRGGESLDARADERVSGLVALRETMPVAVRTPGGTPRRARRDWRHRIAEQWFRLPRGLRLAMPLAALAMIASGATLGYRAQSGATSIVIPAMTPAQAEAAWAVPGALLRYQSETDTVGYLLLDPPHLQVESLHVVAGGEDFLLVVAGTKDSALAGRRGVWRYQPEEQQTEVVVPLLPEGPDGFQLLAAWRDTRTLSPQVLVNTPGGVWSLAGSFAARSLFSSETATTAALAPASGRLLLPSPSGSGARLVDLTSSAHPERSIAWEGGAIQACALAPDSSALAVLSKGQPLGTLTLEPLLGLESSRTLSTDVVSLGAQAFSPDGRHLVAGVQIGPARHAQVFETGATQSSRDLGPGALPLWVPNRDAVLVLAPDYADRAQIWSLALDAAVSREQVTFVGAGVGDVLAVSGSGSYALSASTGEARLVIVKL